MRLRLAAVCSFIQLTVTLKIDFNADQLQIIRPSQEVASRLVALDELPMEQRLAVKDRIFEQFFNVENLSAPGRNAILDEQNDFALSITT